MPSIMTRIAPAVAFSGLIALSACSSTRTREISLNQVPQAAQTAILEHAKNGKIEEIKSKERKGQEWYEVQYRLNNQEYFLVVDEAGALVEKDRD